MRHCPNTKGFFRCYEPKTFNDEQLALIGASNDIMQRYEAMGYVMSVRQIYYQLVVVNAIENKPTSYDRLSALLSDARLGWCRGHRLRTGYASCAVRLTLTTRNT